MSQVRGGRGSAGRPGDSSPKALLRTWYEAFLVDTLQNYPGVDELPANFVDFDYVWSTFQTSNRKLRGTVVELTDFERETVLEYLRDELAVLDFDADQEVITWHPKQVEQVELPATQRRPWSQATNNWGSSTQTPKTRPDVEDVFWDASPTQGPVDPAWQISWAGDTPSQQVQPARQPLSSTNKATRPQQQSSNKKPPTQQQASSYVSNKGKLSDQPSSLPTPRAGKTHQQPSSWAQKIKPSPPPGSSKAKSKDRPSDQPASWAKTAPQASSGGGRPSIPSGGRPSIPSGKNGSSSVDDSKKRAQSGQLRPASKSTGPVDPPPLKKRPTKDSEPTPAVKSTSRAAVAKKADKKQSLTDERNGTKQKSEIAATMPEPPKKAQKSKAQETFAEEPPSWKKSESSEKKGSGMALLGFDYL